jgi:TRAP-type C4-dicarboxylate transport system substrate-binding protein
MATALMLSVLTVSSAWAVEWKYSSWTPPNAPNNRFGSIPFMENVTKATNGEVTFKNFMGSQLFNAMTTLQGIRDGVVDAGVTVPAFNAAELKYHTMIAEMQGFTRDGYSAAGAATETVLLNCPECMAEYDKNNTRMLGTYSSPTWYMQCAFEPKTVADLKGTKLGAAGTASNARLAAAFGQTRITGGPGDYLQSMTNRAIDCVIGPKEWLKSISLKDAVKTVIDNQGVGHFVAISIMTVNKNSWAKLTDKQRAAFLAEMPRAIARTTHGYHAEEELGAKEGQAKGVKFVSLGQEFVEVWQRYLKTERGDVIEQGKKVGIANAEDLVSRYEKNIKKWEAIIDRVGKSEEALAKALQDEVFSKVKM